MPTFRAINTETQEIVQYTESSIRPEHLVPPWRVEEVIPVTVTYPNDPPLPVYGGRRSIQRTEFLKLFTSAERVAMRDFSTGNSAAAKALLDYMRLIELSDEVSLDDPDTVEFVNQLEQRALIAAGRGAEILYG